MHVYVGLCVCVCVCERERERETVQVSFDHIDMTDNAEVISDIQQLF